MSNDINITPGSGATVATEDVGSGREVQLVKPVWGPSGAFNEPDTPTGLPIQYQLPTSHKLTWASVSFNASGDNTLVAGVTAQTIRVFALILVTAGQTNLTFKDSTPTSFTGAMPLSGITLDFNGEPYFVTATGKGFQVNSSQAVQVSGMVGYIQS